MIKIDLLKNHPHFIPNLANIWYEVLGKIWLPDVAISQVEQKFLNHLNSDSLPITWIALDSHNQPIGMCSLRENDGILPHLTPWLGGLVVSSTYQNKGIGKMLIQAVKQKAKELDFKMLYLFAFDQTIPTYYKNLGWEEISIEEFKNHPVTVMRSDL